MNLCQCSCTKINFLVPHQPQEICHCHCHICQSLHNKTFASFAKYDLNCLRIDFSQLDSIKSSQRATRYRCSNCHDWVAMIYNQSQFIWVVTDTFLFNIDQIETYDIYLNNNFI